MNDFKLVIDGACDLPPNIINETGMVMMPLSLTIGESQFISDDPKLDVHEFYERMRAGEIASTAQLTPVTAAETFEKNIKEGFDVLYLAFSSALTGGLNNANLAATDLREKYPQARIELVDSLSASGGYGFLAYHAAKYKNNGHDMDETLRYISENIPHVVHNFTVDDLAYLARSGRLSKGSAFMGNLLSIKPVLHTDDEGRLVPLYKVKGRKKSLEGLVNDMEKKMGSYREANDVVFINNADTPEDAEFIKTQLKERFGIENVLIWNIGPIIGSHTGPGTMALFHFGEIR